ncbi:MAG: type II secretion system protein M [Saccharofermentans sp.]|nr:type II secretion system protein M [Saccharofermentans sp.]
MNNLGSRERNLFIIFGIFLLCVILYVGPIRLLNNSTADLKVEREALQAQKDYYDALAEQNEATRAEIENIEADIAVIEGTFLPNINTECLAQWVLNVFEENNCKWLVKINTEDAAAPDIVLPDGSLAEDNVIIKSVMVEYSTSDGWNVSSYGGDDGIRENTLYDENGIPQEAVFDSYMTDRTYAGMNSREGYTEFLAALQQIEQQDEDCIKVSRIAVEEESGYILMYATIDFYSATFVDRVSEPDTNAPYVTWSGATDIATDHGFIGMPFFVDDPGSEWFGVIMPSDEATDRTRPFAAYYSVQTWANLVNNSDVATALGLDSMDGLIGPAAGGEAENPDDTTPDDVDPALTDEN